jgi:hypothetical protein
MGIAVPSSPRYPALTFSFLVLLSSLTILKTVRPEPLPGEVAADPVYQSYFSL